MKTVRRTILVVGSLIGLCLCFWTTPRLFRVDPVDWEKHRLRKERHAEQLTQMASQTVGRDVSGDVDVYAETRLDREAYINHETRGQQVTVEGATWEGFFNGVRDTVMDRAPSASWAKRRGRAAHHESLYFRTDEAPLSTLTDLSLGSAPFLYVRIEGRSRSEYLFVKLSDRADFFRHAPSFLVFPHRSAGLIWILSACLLYLLLSRRRTPVKGSDEKTLRKALLPKLPVTLLCGISAGLLAITWPPADPSIPARGFPMSEAVQATPSPANNMLVETIQQEEELLEALEAVQLKLDSISSRMKTASPAERKALAKESDRYLVEVERLQRLFEKISNADSAPRR